MDIKQLQKPGAFVSDELVERQIEWNGKTFVVHIKKASFGAIDNIYNSSAGNSRTALLIAECVRFDGGESLTHEQAFQLDARLAMPLVEAITEVNQMDSDPKG